MTTEMVDIWADRSSSSRRWIWLTLAFGVIVAGGVGFHYWHEAHALDAVTASAGRLSLEPDTGEILQIIDRQASLEVWYRVTLDNGPDGAVLPLTCSWIDPGGKTYHKNKYDTHPVTHADWPTHARCRIRPNALVGAWRVELRLQDRLLHQVAFEVRDGKAEKPKNEK